MGTTTYKSGSILEDIAERAINIKHLTEHGLDSLDDVEKADAMFTAVIDMAQRIGWLADLAASQIPGLSAYVGNAENWMLPERFRCPVNVGDLNTGEG